ncbi:MAG TPA: hypothetical protein VK993_04090 [Chthoniobacterales bacterium]|nr:hypothetical protein [Chthoniobacterales bacterium]
MALTALAVALHVYYTSKAGGLWRDEANTAALASMPAISDIWHHLPFESFPMLWPLIVRLFQSLGCDSDLALRWLGCFVGLSIVAALWLNARLLGFSVPLLSLALLGCNPMVIRSGDSMRAYGVGVVLILLLFALLWKVATAPSPPVVALAGLVTVASAQALYHNAALVFAICVSAAVIAGRKRQWARSLAILGIGAIAALSLVPYLEVIQRARSWDVVSVREFSPWIFGARLFEAISAAGNAVGWFWLVLLLLGMGSAIATQSRPGDATNDDERQRCLYGVLAIAISVAASFGFLRLVAYPTQAWYYLPLLGVLAVAIESSLAVLPLHRARVPARLVLAIAVVLLSAVPLWKGLQLRQTNVDLAAAQLRDKATAGDVIMIAPWYLGVTLDRYYKGPASKLTIPPIDDLRVQRYDLLKSQMEAVEPIAPVLGAVERALKAGHRVWIVGGLLFPPAGKLPPSLAPAPFESFGWDEGAYMSAWTMQAGHFLQQHALHAEEVPLATQAPINSHETVQLLVVRGWR